jgi:hypothetical protein
MDDYQALGLGDAPSVVTSVTVDTDEQSILLSCLYNPQQAPLPYSLWFRQCENIIWDTFGDVSDLQHLEAELVGLSLQTNEAQKVAVITTDVFELSFCYGSFSLERSSVSSSQSASNYSFHPTAARERF